jgi:hypothetical protein
VQSPVYDSIIDCVLNDGALRRVGLSYAGGAFIADQILFDELRPYMPLESLIESLADCL